MFFCKFTTADVLLEAGFCIKNMFFNRISYHHSVTKSRVHEKFIENFRFTKSSCLGLKVHKSMNFVHDLATLTSSSQDEDKNQPMHHLLYLTIYAQGNLLIAHCITS